MQIGARFIDGRGGRDVVVVRVEVDDDIELELIRDEVDVEAGLKVI